jgi:hypothetical protein
MDRNHGHCRRCRQIVRTDWRMCAHCGVASPIPRSAGQRLGTAALVTVVAAAGWWAIAEADAGGRLALGARGLVRSATTIEEHGRPMAPSVTSGAGSSGGELARSVGTSSSGGSALGGGTGGWLSGSSAGGSQTDRTRSDEGDGRDQSRDDSADTLRATGFGASLRSASVPLSEQSLSAATADSAACSTRWCGMERPVGGTGDTLAAAMRRAGRILAGPPARDRGRTGPGGLLLPPPLVP